MPWRLILLIIILAVLLAFITFNMENRCDISFGKNIKVIHDVPVFLTIFTSFILGMLCTLPLILSAGKKRNETVKDKKQDKKPAKDNFSDSDDSPYNINIGNDEKIKQDAAAARERFLAKRRGNK